jgi:hypothetical protein
MGYGFGVRVFLGGKPVGLGFDGGKNWEILIGQLDI